MYNVIYKRQSYSVWINITFLWTNVTLYDNTVLYGQIILSYGWMLSIMVNIRQNRHCWPLMTKLLGYGSMLHFYKPMLHYIDMWHFYSTILLSYRWMLSIMVNVKQNEHCWSLMTKLFSYRPTLHFYGLTLHYMDMLYLYGIILLSYGWILDIMVNVR